MNVNNFFDDNKIVLVYLMMHTVNGDLTAVKGVFQIKDA